MSSPLAALAAPIDTYVNYKTQEHLMDKSLENSKEMAEVNYLNQRRMARDATPLAVMGMREAGLNPSSMSEPMNPGSVPGTGLGSTPQAPQMQMTQALLADAQIKNIEAQTEKTQVETQNMQDENATVDVNLRRHFQTLLDDPNISDSDKKFYQSIIEHAPSYSAGSLKGLKDYFALKQQSTDVMFNEFDKNYKKAVIDANLRHDVPNWLARLSEQQFNEVVQKIGNIQANTLLLASEVAINSDKADKLRAEIQKDYAEMKHIYHEDWAAMMENKDYWALFMGLTEKVLPSVVQGVAFGKAFKSGSPVVGSPVVGSQVSGSSIMSSKITPLAAQAQIKAGGVPKMDAVSKGIFMTFKNDKDRSAFLSLLARRGSQVANQSFHQWIASPYRSKYSYADWLGIGEKYHR